MKHIRAFFGALKEWFHRHPVSLSSPSGLSKTWILVQVASVLYETGSQIIVPVPGEETGFTVTRLSGVKDFDDLVKKAKEEQIIKLGDEDIKSVFKKLTKKKNFPFFASQPQYDPSDKSSSENLEKVLSESLEQGNEVTVIRLTQIRDKDHKYIKIPGSTNEVIHVPRDGSHATSLILLVHSQSPQTDSEDNHDTQIKIPNAKPSLSGHPCQPAEGQFQLFRNTRNQWRMVGKDKIGQCCLRFSKEILTEYFQSDIENLDMSVWQRISAFLLLKIDELIKEDKHKLSKDLFSILKNFSEKQSWKDMQTSAKDVLKENWNEAVRPTLVSLPDCRSTSGFRPHETYWAQLSDSTASFEDFFRTKTANKHGSSTARRCPTCGIGYFSRAVDSTGWLQDSFPDRRQAVSGQPMAPEPRKCPACAIRGISNVRRDILPQFKHSDSESAVSIPVPEVQCQDFPNASWFTGEEHLLPHASLVHLDNSMSTGSKRKAEESPSQDYKRISQVNSYSSPQHSFESVSSPEVQLLDTFKNTENETASTSYDSNTPYSDQSNTIHGQENSKITYCLPPAVLSPPDVPNLSDVFGEDEINRLLSQNDSPAVWDLTTI